MLRRPSGPPAGARRPSAFHAALGTLCWLLALALAALVGVRVFGAEHGTVLALLVGALPVSLLPAYPLLLGAMLARRGRLGALSAALVAAHLLVVAPALSAADLPAGLDTAPSLRVVVSNLYVLNPTPEQAGAALRALRPDVLIVPELDQAGLAGLTAAGLLTDLPFHAVDLAGRTETVGLFSRLPLSEVSFRASGTRSLPRATVLLDGARVRLLAAHPLPPLGGLEGFWRGSLRSLAEEAQALDSLAVVAGDFNADRDHAPFRALLSAGLRDVHDERGRGLARTWPAAFPLLQLDHVLVHDADGARLVPRRVREVRVPGSDHRAVVTDLALVRG